MFAKSFLTAAAACSLLVSSVNAHMVITSPVPYGADSLTNSPLEPDGSDFPCKQRSGVYDIGTMNQIPVGVPQKLSFKGGATHGGGSCQLSVTLDKEPTKNSQWKVIHSILGGCPNSDAGNANGSPDYAGNPTFEYTMPKGMPNGEYTMAWTWFNKIGNREMYMNCAPITVTGGADNNDVLDTLPDMFVANIGNGCTTCENEDFVFPQCGRNVETVMKTALGSSTIGTCAVATGGAGSGSSGAAPSAPVAYSTPASSPAAPTGYGPGSGASAPAQGSAPDTAPTAPSYGTSSAAAQAPAPTGYGGASSAEGGPAGGGVATAYEVVTQTAMRTITADGPAPSGYASPAASGPPETSDESGSSNKAAAGNTTSSSSKSVACTTQDEIICMDGGKFGICDNGFAVPMQLSDGMSCSAGVISKRSNMGRHLRQHIQIHGHKR